MEKITVSFQKDRYDLVDGTAWMILEGFDETAIELFRLTPKERNDRLVELMKERGVNIKVDTEISNRNLSVREKIQSLADGMYRRLSDRLNELDVPVSDLYSLFPAYFDTIKIIEKSFDALDFNDEKSIDMAGRLSYRFCDIWDKIFIELKKKKDLYKETKKNLLDTISPFLSKDVSLNSGAKQEEPVPIIETKIEDDNDPFGLM